MPAHDFAAIAPWLRLSQCPGIGALRAARLLQAFGSPQAIFAQSADALLPVLGQRALVEAVLTLSDTTLAYLEQARAWLEGDTALPGVARAIWTLADAHYPASLRELTDPPLALYAVGATRWLHPEAGQPPWWQCSAANVAIVGSRQPTAQGAQNAHQFAAWLQAAGVSIVSGLARGIDAAAHEGALQAAQANSAAPATVAVMGTGADRIYPASHKPLAQRIAQNGLLLTEQPLGAPPLATHFPKRNRIITGLSQATLVVEATQPSGSLLSARLALEQGREVMAIPGSIHSPQSKGCHWLIKQGAKLVDHVTDVLEELSLQPPATATGTPDPAAPGPIAPSPTSPTPAADAEADTRPAETAPAEAHPAAAPTNTQALLQALGYDPVSLESLAERTGLPTALLQTQLLELELAGHLARLPGGLFQRLAQA